MKYLSLFLITFIVSCKSQDKFKGCWKENDFANNDQGICIYKISDNKYNVSISQKLLDEYGINPNANRSGALSTYNMDYGIDHVPDILFTLSSNQNELEYNGGISRGTMDSPKYLEHSGFKITYQDNNTLLIKNRIFYKAKKIR